MKIDKKQLRAHWLHELSPFWQKLQAERLSKLVDESYQWLSRKEKKHISRPEVWLHQQLCFFAIFRIEQDLDNFQQIQSRYATYIKNTKHAVTSDERWQHQKTFLQELGYSKKQLRADHAAFKRWFDDSAILDRYQDSLAQIEANVEFTLTRLGAVLANYREQFGEHEAYELFRALDIESFSLPILKASDNKRMLLAMLRCFNTILLAGDEEMALPGPVESLIYAYANQAKSLGWVQVASIEVLLRLGRDTTSELIRYQFAKASDDVASFFIRAKLLELALTFQSAFTSEVFEYLISLARTDKSPLVRQKLLKCLHLLDEPQTQATVDFYLGNESEPAVMAALWCAYPEMLKRLDCASFLMDRYWRELEKAQREGASGTQDTQLLRLMIEIIPELYQALNDSDKPVFYECATEKLTQLNKSHELTRVRRWSAKVRQYLWFLRHGMSALVTKQTLDTTKLGAGIKIPVPKDALEQDIARSLSSLAIDSHGFDLERGRNKLNMRSGYREKFRLWRWLHEFRIPATDKRQNYSHVHGRVYHGLTYIASEKLGEMSQTKVPGEPLYIPAEQGWRPYLPLLDQVLSSLDQGWPTKPLRIYTPEGVTNVLPPKNIVKRLWAKLSLSYRFESVARLRNWQEDSHFDANDYVNELRKLGFVCSIEGYQESSGVTPVDPRVSRFFASFLPVWTFPELWRDMQNYFYSVYQNTLQQLALFLVALFGFFFGRHLWLNHRFRQARKSIPLVIGGWGTRGKSGTERLKAALFNSLGIPLVSKSTGCEAQFLFASENRPLREMFLFRPYDKATIWEQVNLTCLAQRLNVKLFLWECMGLTPRYIEILQQQWMRDDIATITNCYPDHEDIQGPAGIDIPKVMTRFVPKNSVLITSEDSMSPLLQSAARKQQTDYVPVNWLDSFLLTSDVVNYFPYEEHPTNIALVLRLAQWVGVQDEEALKAMAELVVPDLGVLKVYPITDIDGRRFKFINGMSANERLAALGNWTRLGLDKLSLDENPDTWLSVVINNRADRVARSKVFAQLMAYDIKADHYFLIGNNLDGLFNYVEEAWESRIDQLFSGDETNDSQALAELFQALCVELRVYQSEQQVRARAHAMLQGLQPTLSLDPESDWRHGLQQLENTEIPERYLTDLTRVAESAEAEQKNYANLLNQISSSQKPPMEALKTFLWQSFSSRIIVVEDYHISGPDLVKKMVSHSPPGLLNTMMGMQNIKGTGLDFIYQWQTWNEVHTEFEKVKTGQPKLAEDALKRLAAMTTYGPLASEYVTQSVLEMRDHKIAQTELFQAELNIISGKVDPLVSESTAEKEARPQKSKAVRFKHWLLQISEDFLDSGDAVRRRKKANRIYKDLAARRIGVDRAVDELKNLNKTQKGGWLQKRFEKP